MNYEFNATVFPKGKKPCCLPRKLPFNDYSRVPSMYHYIELQEKKIAYI